MKKTLVLGASLKPERYAYQAIELLRLHQHDVIAIGHQPGKIADITVLDSQIEITNLHTITIYLNIEKQQLYYDYIINLQPKRVIFNPGTENATFQLQLEGYGIEVLEACTLVLVRTNQY